MYNLATELNWIPAKLCWIFLLLIKRLQCLDAKQKVKQGGIAYLLLVFFPFLALDLFPFEWGLVTNESSKSNVASGGLKEGVAEKLINVNQYLTQPLSMMNDKRNFSQTCKTLFQNRTQSCYSLNPCNAFSSQFRAFLRCKCIHNLECERFQRLFITNQITVTKTQDYKSCFKKCS